MVTGAIVGAMNIGLRHPVPAFSRSFYFMIMARAGYGGNWLVWCGIGGGCNLDCILLIWRRHAVKHGNYLTDGVCHKQKGNDDESGISRSHHPDMHWDREWYFTTEESRILLVIIWKRSCADWNRTTNTNITYRRANGDPRRLFRGETGKQRRVKKQVEAGKLIIGPWYTQTIPRLFLRNPSSVI